MKILKVGDLKEGNIITFELKLKGRESFEVEHVGQEEIVITSRLKKSIKTIKKMDKNVYLLHESEPKTLKS